jgi:large subunit ribosomal protein L1
MSKHGKRYQKAAALMPRRENPVGNPGEALKLVKDAATAKFDESVEIAVRLGVDPRHADQVVRGTVVLPHGTGKTVRVLVLAQGEKVREAQEAGADFVGLEHVQKIKDGWLDFDVAVATPDVMGQVGQLGRVLGPRGLMPSPKAGTVTFDVGKAVKEIKGGKIEFRVDKTGNLHAPIGRISFTVENLTANLDAFMDTVVRAKPSTSKGTYIRTVTVSSTMGPGVRIDPNLYRRVGAR